MCDRPSCCFPEEFSAPHTCPFKTEVNEDYETECECCPDCTGECAMEV